MKFDAYLPFLAYGDFADVYLERTEALHIRWEDGRVEAISSSLDSGAGLRYLNGLETRFGFTDIGDPFGRLAAMELERLQAVVAPLVGGLPPLDPAPSAPVVLKSHPVAIPPAGISLDDKIALLEAAFKIANRDARIRQVAIGYGERRKSVAYANSDGEAFAEDRTYTVLSIMVTAERNGDLQNAYEAIGGVAGWEILNRASVEALAAEVAERALRKLAAPVAPAGEMPVVIAASAGGTLIHEAVGHALEADAVLEGTSPSYAGKLGERVADSKLTVFDNPTVPGKRGTFYFDDEGVASEASRLIENGVLRDYMFDRLSARRAGRKSNGHGRRESYAHRPIPRMSNTYIAPGSDNPDEIVAGLKNGLLVTKMGGGQVNTANGDFVFDVEEGFEIKNGVKKMVRGATLLGNGPAVLESIDLVGSDHGWGIGTCGKEGQGVPVSDAVPTIRIKKLVVGGGQK